MNKKFTLGFFLINLLFTGAQAQIIYRDFNPDTKLSKNGSYGIDINKDSKHDFAIQFFVFDSTDAWLLVEPVGDNKIAVQKTQNNSSEAKRFATGELIDGSALWEGGPISIGFRTFGEGEGSWAGKGEACMGIQLNLNGNTTYAWLRMSIDSNVFVVTLMEMGAESEQDLPVQAGAVKSYSAAIADISYTDPSLSIRHLNKTLQISIGTHHAGLLNIYDTKGSLIATYKLTRGETLLPVPDTKGGLYIVELSAEGFVTRQKILFAD